MDLVLAIAILLNCVDVYSITSCLVCGVACHYAVAIMPRPIDTKTATLK